jgi:endonuclease-3
MKKQPFNIDQAIGYLRSMAVEWKVPYVTDQSKRTRNPFRVLVSTILSSRTKDEVTGEASMRLFKRAPNPQTIARLSEKEIARLIYPVGFYNTKSKTVKQTCKKLVEEFNGKVPHTMEELLTLPGVGRKTANLVISLGFNLPGICVDTHVHRISNRWGIVKTKSPAETETALRKKLPQKYWIEFNTLLVTFGQNICNPTSPKCSLCGLERMCPQKNVTRKR